MSDDYQSLEFPHADVSSDVMKIDQIKNNLADIKKSVEDVNKKIEAFDKEKNTLAQEVIADRQKEIEDLKLDIEKKKLETQELIKKTRELANLEQDVNASATIKQELDNYEKQLKDIQPRSSGFREKVKENGGKAVEWVKKNQWQTAGIGLAVAGIIYLFRRRKKKKEEDESGDGEKKENKGFWDKWYGKTLKWGAIGTGAFFLIKWLLTGKNPLLKDNGDGTGLGGTLRDTSNAAENYEETKQKDPEKAKSSDVVGNDVNELYDYVHKFDNEQNSVLSTDEKLGGGKEKYAGAIPLILDNTFGKINDLESERGLFTVGAYGDIDEMVKIFSETIGKGIGTGIGRLVNKILSMIGMPAIVDGDNISEKIKTFLAGSNNVEEVHRVFRKIFKTMAYLNYAENAYLGKKVEGLLSSGIKLYEKYGDKREMKSYDKSEIKELTKNIVSDPSGYKVGEQEVENIKNDEFRNKKICDISSLNLTKDDILQYNDTIKESVDDINEKRKEKINQLATDKNKVLDKMKSNVESELSDSVYKSVCNTVPVVHLLEIFGVDREDEVKKKIMEYGGYKELFSIYKDEFEKLKTESDINKIKQKIDLYYAQLKEVSITAAGIYEAQDENGNMLLHIGTPIWNVFSSSGKMFLVGPTMILKGGKDIVHGDLSGAWDTVKGVYFLGVGAGPFLALFRSTRSLGLKMTFAPLTVPYKITSYFLKPYMKTHIIDWIPQIGGMFYKTSDSLIQGLANGMSTQSAFRIYENILKNRGNLTGMTQNFVRDILGIGENTSNGFVANSETKMICDLIDKKRFDVLDNMVESHLKSKIRFWKGKYINFDNGVKELKPIYDILQQKPGIQEIGFKLLERTDFKNRSKIKDLLSRDDVVQELSKITKPEEVNALAKGLSKAMKKIDNIDVDTVKNIISKISSIQTKAGKNAGDVIENIVQQAARSGTTVTVEQIANQTDDIIKQLQTIKNTDVYQDVVSLGLETNAAKYANLVDDSDDINNLARKILNEWNVIDNNDYFNDATKIAQAKAYADFLLKSKKVETVIEGTQELSNISSVLSLGDYNKLAKLVNKGKTDDVVKFLTKRLEKEGVENPAQLAQQFAEKTKGMKDVNKTDIAKIIGLSEKNTEKAIVAITKTLSSDKAFVSSILALNGDQKLIAQALNDKCGLTGTQALIAEDCEYVQKLAKCKKTQDIEKTLQYTSTGLKWRIVGAGVTSALAIAGAVMSIIDTVNAFNMIDTTNNEDLKDVYRTRGFVNASFAALDALIATDAVCNLAYLAFSMGQGAFMSTGIGAVVILAAQGIKYVFDQYSLGAEFQVKNAEDWSKEGLGLYFIWYYRSGGKTSGENVKDTFGSASDMPLANIVEGLIDQTLGIQEGSGTPEHKKVKGYMKDYIQNKYDNKVDHMENGFSILGEALEYATFADYMSNIKNGIIKQDQISTEMNDFISKYPIETNQSNIIDYFGKYRDFHKVNQSENLQKYKTNLQKYSDQELIFIYEQLGRYNNYYTLSVEGTSVFVAIKTLLKEKNIDMSKSNLDFEEPPINREEIEKFISSSGEQGQLHESIGDASEVKGKIDQFIISDEVLIDKYGAVPTLEIYTFFKIAKIFGYQGLAELDGIKLFLSEDTKDGHGIYRNGNEWKINNTSFWSGFRFGRDIDIGTGDDAVNKLKYNIDKIGFDDKYLGAFDSDGIKVKFQLLRDDIEKKIELNKFQTIEVVTKEEIIQYLKNNNGEYTLLSVELLSRLLQKNNVKNSGHYMLKYENNKVMALSLDTQAKEKLFFIDEFDTSAESKFKYEKIAGLDIQSMMNRFQDLKNIIYADNDDFDVKDNPQIEKIINDKQAEIETFINNMNNYEQVKQEEMYYKKLDEVESFYQSFLISFLSQSADNTYSNDVDDDDADEKILQATKYGEWQNFNTVIVNKYKKEYNILQLSDQEMQKLKQLDGGMDYINYYYRSLSLAMFKSYVLYKDHGTVHTQYNHSLEFDQLKSNLGEILSYNNYMKTFKGKKVTEEFFVNFMERVDRIKNL